MKTRNLFLGTAMLLLLFTALSCKKSGSGNNDNITYEVKVTSGTWSGSYNDYSGSNLAVKFVNTKPNGWKYSFTITHGTKAGLVISAIPDNSSGGNATTANIYMNGQLIATDTEQYGAYAQIAINQ